MFNIISPIISKITNVDFDEIDFDEYFKQTETYQTMSQDLSNNNDKSVEEIYISNLKQDMKNKLQEKGYIYEEDGAVWFRSTDFGDDKNRVLRKSDGSYTYGHGEHDNH